MIIKPASCSTCVLGHAPFGGMTGFIPADGSGDNGVLMVLEAGGGNEAETGIPVTGAAGQYLFSNLKRVDIERDGFRIHNVLSCQPPDNKLVKMPWEREAIEHCAPFLDETIAQMRDKCHKIGKHFTILTLGRTAFKRIMGFPEGHPVMKRDYQCYVHWSDKYGAWVVAADHPSFLMRGNNSRLPILQFAVKRALEVAENGFEYDNPTYLTTPTLSASGFATWIEDYIRAEEKNPTEVALAYDIETPYKAGKDEAEIAIEDADDYTILCHAFAYDRDCAVSVPHETTFMGGIEQLYAYRGVKVGWNSAIYDDPRIQAKMPMNGPIVDGMLAWHVLNSALPKGLGFVTPFYTQNAQMWKHLADTEPAKYSAADGHYTVLNYYGIKRDLIANNLWKVFERHVIKLNVVLNYMTSKGLMLDTQMRAEAEVKLATILGGISGKMAEVVPLNVQPTKQYKTVPPELRGLEGDKLYAAAEEGNFYRQDVLLDTKMCARCGAVSPRAAHFKAIGKKAIKAGGMENPCLGAGVQPAQVLVPLWHKRLEFKLSSKSLQAYQSVMAHKAVLSRTKGNGTVTFDSNALTILQRRYPEDPLYQIIGEHRRVQKLLSTYVGITGEDGKVRGGMPVGRDGRVHTTLTHNPSTLRLASQNPNLQNLPRPGKAEDLETIIRNLFLASPGYNFLARDYSGIEAVLVGYEAKSPEYIRLAKMDVHSFYTAYALNQLDGRVSANDLPLLSWDDEKLAKRLAEIKAEFKLDRNNLYKHLTHAINFGQGAKGAQDKILLETQIIQPLETIQTVMGVYKELFKAIPRWHGEIRLQADRDGFLRNAFGYVHRFNRVFAYTRECGKWVRGLGDDAEAVLAFKPQSNAAAIIKEALIRLYFDRFNDAGQFLRLQVHDEVFTETPEEMIAAVDRVLREEMERPIPELPLPASWGMGQFLTVLTEEKVGKRWGSMC